MEIVRLHTLPPGAGLIFFYPLMYLLLLKLEWNREGNGMWWIFDKESLWRAICQWGFLTVSFSLLRLFHPSFQEPLCDPCLVKKFDLHSCFMMAARLRHFHRVARSSLITIESSPSHQSLWLLSYYFPTTQTTSYPVSHPCPSSPLYDSWIR